MSINQAAAARVALPPPRALTRVAIVGSCAGFALIGALQAFYGPAIPTFQDKFHVPAASAGLSLTANFVGALLGVLVFHRLRLMASNRVMICTAYALMAIGASLFAVAPRWPFALAMASLAGLGFGGLDYGLNHLFSVGFGHRGAAMLNLLNAMFGVGAVAGPPLIGWIGPQRYPAVFLGLAAVSAALTLTARGIPQPATAARSAKPRETTAGGLNANKRALVLVVTFIVLYVMHVAVETGVGGWEPTHLEFLGYSTRAAATATSAFWLAMTVGRFLVIPISLRRDPAEIVTISCLGMAICLPLAAVPALAPVAYVAVGLFIAPIFPTGLPWLNRVVPGIGGATAYVVAASMLGGVFFPPLLGGIAELTSAWAIPFALLGFAMICAAASVTLKVVTRGGAS